MQINGVSPQYNRKAGKTEQNSFSFEVPVGCHTLYDASQSTLVVKNAQGHTLLALKHVEKYWVDSIDVSWDTSDQDELHDTIETLKSQVARLEAEINFHREINGKEEST